MKKAVLLLYLSLHTLIAVSQDRVGISVYQDARLALAKDNTGNYKPFTLDVLVKFNMEGKQSDVGYIVVSPMFEYADLNVRYTRYAADVGFTFNQSLIEGFSVTPSINYGIQDRHGRSWLVFGADLEASYEISDKVSINILGQSVERKDLQYKYNDYKIGFSGFVGVTYYLK
jgi:hypothetical protein